jgi:U3 small nucleolar ribonucleoprotein protein IMP4
MVYGIVINAKLNGQALHIRHINIIFTSSRDPPLRVRRFLNELVRVIPGSLKINRGRQSLDEIFKKALEYNARYLVIFRIVKGNPAELKVIDLYNNYVKYIFNIKGVTLLSDKKIKIKFGNDIEKGCIRLNKNHTLHDKCKEVINMLIDFGINNIENCEYYAEITQLNNICEVSFKDLYSEIIGPIIRFLL